MSWTSGLLVPETEVAPSRTRKRLRYSMRITLQVTRFSLPFSAPAWRDHIAVPLRATSQRHTYMGIARVGSRMSLRRGQRSHEPLELLAQCSVRLSHGQVVKRTRIDQ